MNEKIIFEIQSKNNKPSRKLNKFIGIISKAYKTLAFYIIFIENEPSIIKKFNIKNTPTIIYFKNSREINRIEGLEYKKIISMLDNAESD